MSHEADIRKRLAAATPPPWVLSADKEAITQTSHITRDVWTIPRTHEDMTLIANAPADLAFLLAALEKMREVAGVCVFCGGPLSGGFVGAGGGSGRRFQCLECYHRDR